MSVSLLTKLAQTIVDQSLVEQHSVALEVVATVASHTGTSVHLKHSQALHDLVVTKSTEFATVSNDVSSGLSPSSDDDVVVLVLRDGDSAVDDVADLTQEGLSLSDDCLCLLLLLLNTVIEGF